VDDEPTAAVAKGKVHTRIQVQQIVRTIEASAAVAAAFPTACPATRADRREG
tara:strand:- start:3026 stop:3181 length:156 start_codon:yes stop_codon:yes gene_type:complete